MIRPADFYKLLLDHDISFFTGVPDSLLKDFCGYVNDNVDSHNHVIAANEGGAVALAAGYHLATGKYPLVYMQNSGFGNALNPLLSLADREVYGIPMLLVIGWRGEPGLRDEPQHIKQGRVQESLLKASEIDYEVINESTDELELEHILIKLISSIETKKNPAVLLVRKNSFEKYEEIKNNDNKNLPLTRERAIQIVINSLNEDDIIVSSTGKISREVYEYRLNCNMGHKRDFLTVGSMGHCSKIAFGIALQKRDKIIYCLDGDGAAIMHMGSMAVIGSFKLENFKHIILNNGVHESVGGQPTVGFNIDFCSIAKAAGYQKCVSVSNENELINKIDELRESTGTILLEIKVNSSSREDLIRPKTTPFENKGEFVEFIR